MNRFGGENLLSMVYFQNFKTVRALFILSGETNLLELINRIDNKNNLKHRCQVNFVNIRNEMVLYHLFICFKWALLKSKANRMALECQIFFSITYEISV